MKVSYEERIKGRLVIDALGRSIGSVEELYVDDDSFDVGLRVCAVRVRLHAAVADEVGVPRSAFHAAMIEVPALALQAFGDAIILNASLASLVPRRAETQAHAE
jgi:sporulation protein YlmC with PRC-barrel domain